MTVATQAFAVDRKVEDPALLGINAEIHTNTKTGMQATPILNDSVLYLTKGLSFTANNRVVTSDKKIVSVSKLKFTGKKVGSTVLELDGMNYNTDVFTAKVSTKQTQKGYVGDVFNLTLQDSTGKDLRDLNIAWQSSNQNVAQVDDGKVMLVGKGSANIYAYLQGKKYTFKVSSKYKDGTTIVYNTPINKVVNLNSVTGQKVTNIETDSTRVELLKNPKVKMLSPGLAVLHVTTKNGGCTINLYGESANRSSDSKITVANNKNYLELAVGETEYLNFPGLHQMPLWTSSNKKVAVVSEYGVVIPLKEGKSTLSAKVAGSNYKIYLTVKGETKPSEKETYREVHVLDNINDQAGKSVWIDPNGNALLTDPTLKYYAVAFDTNGSDDVIETQSVLEGNTAVRPTDPVRPGYIFSHWSFNGLLYNFTEAVLNHVTLLANWIHVKGYLFIDTNNDGINDTQIPIDDTGKVIGKLPIGSNGLPITEITYLDPDGKTRKINLATDTVPDGLLDKQEEPVEGRTPTGGGDTEITYIRIDTDGDGQVDTVIVVDSNTGKIIGDLPRDVDGKPITTITYTDPAGTEHTVDLTQDEIPTEIIGDDPIVVKPDENKKVYNVEFATNGGTAIPKQEVTAGGKATKPDTPEREEYLFKDWYLNGVAYDFNTPVNSNLILVAEWQHIRGYLYLDTDSDGKIDTRVPIDDTGKVIGDLPTDSEGKPITRITVTDENGNKTILHLDEGGVTSDVIHTSQDETKTPTPSTDEDMLLYGETHTVAFNTDGGTEVPSQYVKDGDVAERPTVPTRKLGSVEYTFSDWLLYGNSYNFDTPVITDLNLRATWQQATGEVYIINSDGSKTRVPFAEGATINEDYFVVPDAEGYVTPEAGETLDDYHFEGWFYIGTDGKLHRYYPKSDTLEEGTELVPKFVKNSYTVTFDSNEGTNLSFREKTVHYGEAYGELPTVKYAGKDFVGWYTDPVDGDHILESTLMDKESNHTLYAHFADKSYEITFDSAGGSEVEKQRVIYRERIGNLPVPELYGNRFDGWYYNDTKITSDTVYTFTDNITLTARWSPKTTIIAFNSSGGQLTETLKEVTFNTAIGELPIPVKEGYSFSGWFDQPTDGNKITSTYKVTTESTIVLYAQYTQNKYMLTFNDGTASSTIIKQVNVPYNSVILDTVDIEDPDKPNFTFEGWYLPDGSKLTATTRMPASPLIISAKWSAEKFNVTFDAQGGVFSNPAESSRQVEYKTAYGDLPEVSKEHHEFLGWYTTPDTVVGTLITKDSIYNQATDSIAYAHWAPNTHTLTMVPGKDMYEFTKTLKYNENIGATPTLGVEGYSFDGWYYGQGSTAIKVQSTDKMPDADLSIYAHWSANSYKVTLDANGGNYSGAPTTYKTITYKEAFGTLPTPEREGFTFTGYKGPDDEDITAASVMNYGSAITVKAQWEAKTYTVTYKKSDGSDYSVEPKTVTYNSQYGTLYTPESVEGQTFMGWNTKADGTGLNISSTDIVSIAMNHTLYSMFGNNVYTITFNSDGGSTVAPWMREFDTEFGSLPTPVKTGYILDGWYLNDTKVLVTDKVPGNNITLVAHWTADPHTKYTVKHYKMNLDGVHYTLEQTDENFGETGAEVTIQPNTYTGFTSPAAVTKTIKPDGSMVVEFQYTRNRHAFTLSNVAGCSTTGSTESGNYYYGSQITLSATTDTGYDWVKWSDNTTSISTSFTMPDSDLNISPVVELHNYTIDYDLDGGSISGQKDTYTVTTDTFTLPTPTKANMIFLGWIGSNGTSAETTVTITKGTIGNLSYKATWKMKTVGYTVKHYLMNLDGVTYDLDSERSYTENVNVDVTPETKTYTGFTSPATQTINVREGIENVVEYYYTRNQYSFTLNEEMGCTVTGGSTGTYYYGKTLTLTATPDAGYDWVKWSDNTATPTITVVIPDSAVTLSPVVALHDYEISYNLAGGTIANNPTSYTVTTPTFTIPNPVKEGYNFVGWTTATISEPQQPITVTKGSTGNIALTANWSDVDYSISYELDGGTITGQKSSYSITTDDFTLPAPTRDGYTFTGWTGSNGTTPETEVTVTKGTTGNLNYVAHWSIITYNIEYDTSGGDISGQRDTYDVTTSTFTLVTPTKTGYTFMGWTGSNGTTPQTTVTIEKGSFGNKSYTANWSDTGYTISYTLDGGTLTDEPTTYTINTETFTLPAPTKTGYTFTGWTGSNGTTPETTVTVTKGSTGNLNYTANWSVDTYTISYDLDGGTAGAGQPADYTIETNTFTLPEPTKTGYTFKGWTGSNGTTPQKTVTIDKGTTGDKSYLANWEVVTYTITYTLLGGTVTDEPTEYNVTTDTFTLPTPTKTGYSFDGWTGSNGTTPTTDVTVTKGTTGNLNYTAHWSTVDYTITYNMDGGTLSDKPTSYNVETETFTLGTPIRTGYTFKGWTGSNGTTPQTTVSVTQGSTGDKTYTANWEIIDYTITYTLGGGTLTGQPETYTVETAIFTLPEPTKDGYTFKGWTGSNGTTPSKTVTIDKGSTGNLNYTANWDAVEYAISYNLEGGSLTGQKTTYTIETTTFTLPEPTKTGYIFDGWTEASGGSTPVKTVSIATGTMGAKEYTAHWTPITYNIIIEL